MALYRTLVKGIHYLGMDFDLGEEFDADPSAVGHLVERGRICLVPPKQRPKQIKAAKPNKTEKPPTEAAFSMAEKSVEPAPFDNFDTIT